MRALHIIFWLLVSGCCLNLSARGPHFTNYTVNDGLPSSIVYHVMQDSRGYIWLATEFGVSRFDGYQFVNFTTEDGLGDNVVFKIHEDSHGRIWFMTYNGKFCYYKDGQIHNHLTDPFLDISQRDRMLFGFFEDKKNTVWIQQMRGPTYRFHADGSTSILNQCLDGDPTRGGWLVSDGSGFPRAIGARVDRRYDRASDQWTCNEHPSDFQINVRSSFLGQEAGTLWWCWNDSLYVVNRLDKRLTPEAKERVPNQSLIIRLDQDQAGNLWVGTHDGVLRRTESGQYDHFLPGRKVSSMLQDREGNYWFSTLQSGIFFAPSIDVAVQTSANGFAFDQFNCVENIDGEIWVGQPDGAYAHIQKDKIQKYDTEVMREPLPYSVNVIEKDGQGRLWIGSDAGFELRKNGKTESFGFGAAAKSFQIDAAGHILYGCTGGAFRMDESTLAGIRSFHLDAEEPVVPQPVIYEDPRVAASMLSDTRTFSMAEDAKGRIWSGKSVGMDIWEKGKSRRFRPEHPAMGYRVSDIRIASDGAIWASTHGGGVLAVWPDTVLHFQKDQGLSSNMCNQIYIESAKSIWICTNNGISRVRLTGPNPLDHAIDIFTANDGLISNEVNDVTMRGDTAWVATSAGLNTFHTSELESKPVAPLLWINGVTVGGKERDHANLLELESSENTLRIHFTGLSFKSRGDITYKYRLIGGDERWRTLSSTAVDFSALRFGEYTFEVMARNARGVWSDRVASLSFRILEPWWRSWWVIALAVSTLFLLVWAYFSRRYQVVPCSRSPSRRPCVWFLDEYLHCDGR
ncbi:MAG: two-component regulator propeller domain-containing protein [Bacteroidota bacterium]